MRNLKKILALVLALMMVLSVMVFASAANYDDYSDKDQISEEYAEAVEVLTGMDIFWGSENSFYPKENVSRAEVATLLYRIMTTDVSGSQVGIYKDYGMFDDVLETNWFAGYVNFAANSEYVVGVGDGKFNPEGDVTGYEWITMLLRAVGYDANGEISGSEWKITAARLAKQAGILGDFNEATLSSALTREQVAYLLFNAIQARKVNYTNAFGYQPSRLGYTIAWDMFRLAKTGTISIDAWGRPGYVWYGESSSTATPNTANYNSTVDTKYAAIEEAYTVHYTTAVTECDVADDTTDRDTNYALYVNGQSLGNYTVNAADTVTKIGAQGRRTEVYSDRIVMIDTFLAQVTDVKAATYDKNNHLFTPATITLTVYDAINGSTAGYVLTNGATNWNYTVGQMVLLNAYTDPTNSATVSGKVDNTNTGKYGEIYGVAESLVGAQSTIWWNAEQHTVNGTDYYDAVKFYLDQAGPDTTNHTWYFDQYGNLIGATDIISTNYAVLKSLQWIPVTGSTGYAQAVLVDMAGNETTVTVSSIDGDAADTPDHLNDAFGGWEADNFGLQYTDNTDDYFEEVGFTPLGDETAFVSNEYSHNTMYQGYAMYRVDTNMNGTVSLQGIENRTAIIGYNDDVKITTGASALLEDREGDRVYNDQLIAVDNSTQFLVKGAGNTYTSYTGTVNVPSFDAGAEVFYVDYDRDNVAEYVYVKTGVVTTASGNHVLYVTSATTSYTTSTGVTTLTNVILDGTATSVTLTGIAAAPGGNGTLATLQAGVGKTFLVNLVGGSVNTATLITSAGTGALYDGANMAIYLGDNFTLPTGTIMSEYDRENYTLGNAPVVGLTSDLTVADTNNYGVWVVYTPGINNTVSCVYVGTALNESADMTATVTEGTTTVWTDEFTTDEQTETYTGDAGDRVTLTVTVAAGATLTGNVSEPVTLLANDTHNKVFAVTSEAGNVTNDYYVKLTGEAANAAMTLEGIHLNDEWSAAPVGSADLDEALENAKDVNLPVATLATLTVDAGNTWGSVKAFDSITDVDANQMTALASISNSTLGSEATTAISGINEGSYLVIMLYNNIGGTHIAYYVYHIV